MQARRPPRIRCSSVFVLVTLLLSFYILSFTFFIFLPTPNPLPSGKRALSLRSLAFLPSLLSTHTYCLQAHPLRWMGHFLLGIFKERAVAMGKPHCNRSISTFLVINLVWDFILILLSLKFSVNPWLVFFFILICLLMWAFLKRERLRWGSPTATAPFALFGFAPTALVNLTRDFSIFISV